MSFSTSSCRDQSISVRLARSQTSLLQQCGPGKQGKQVTVQPADLAGDLIQILVNMETLNNGGFTMNWNY